LTASGETATGANLPLVRIPLPPPSSTGRTFSSPGSEPEIPKNCAVQRNDLLTAAPSISGAIVLYPSIFSEPIDCRRSVPVLKVEADQELAARPMGNGLDDLPLVRKNLPSNITYPLIGVACRLPTKRC
jgi:hypothetical protein